ncbi:MAG: hypothetical protein ACI9S8_001911 [Chlamydiales bacterium]|jgi:hypothetical protein
MEVEQDAFEDISPDAMKVKMLAEPTYRESVKKEIRRRAQQFEKTAREIDLAIAVQLPLWVENRDYHKIHSFFLLTEELIKTFAMLPHLDNASKEGDCKDFLYDLRRSYLLLKDALEQAEDF